MLTRFYNKLEPVYYGQGKKFFYCKDCVFCDCHKKQDCLKCKVNVIADIFLSTLTVFVLAHSVSIDSGVSESIQ